MGVNIAYPACNNIKVKGPEVRCLLLSSQFVFPMRFFMISP